MLNNVVPEGTDKNLKWTITNRCDNESSNTQFEIPFSAGKAFYILLTTEGVLQALPMDLNKPEGGKGESKIR